MPLKQTPEQIKIIKGVVENPELYTISRMVEVVSSVKSISTEVVKHSSAFQCSVPTIEKKNVMAVNGVQVEQDAFFTNAYELAQRQEEHLPFLVEGYLPKGKITTIIASSDTGKSLIARQICAAIATGEETVLGRKINASSRQVAYVSSEDDEQVFIKHIQRWSLEEPKYSNLKSFHIIADMEKFSMKKLLEALTKRPYDLVVIDALADFLGGDLNNALDIRKFFMPLKKVASKMGTTIILVHHIGKKGEQLKPSKSNVLGSQAIESASRCVLQLMVDPNDSKVRLLHIVKCNELPADDKKIALKLRLNDQLLLQPEGTSLSTCSITVGRKKVVPTDLKKLILELHADGFSGRAITERVNSEGEKIGKTKIAQLIKQYVNEQKEVQDGL